jgi:RNA polymerase sigma factor (sigma-70 family)
VNAETPLAELFEASRPRLRAVAYRMLGSLDDADDAVQETWLRFSRSGSDGVQNVEGWLTTIIARVSLTMLRARQSRPDELTEERVAPDDRAGTDPEEQALLADSINAALLIVLDTLTPAERLTFVLHDLFDVPFEEIAPVVGRTPAATRQLASRARRRIRDADAPEGDRREVVAAFLAASRGGDFDALLRLLDPGITLRADAAAVRLGAPAESSGAAQVAGFFLGRASEAQIALVNGDAGAVWAPGGRPVVAFDFTIIVGKITAINLIADLTQTSVELGV